MALRFLYLSTCGSVPKLDPEITQIGFHGSPDLELNAPGQQQQLSGKNTVFSHKNRPESNRFTAAFQSSEFSRL